MDEIAERFFAGFQPVPGCKYRRCSFVVSLETSGPASPEQTPVSATSMPAKCRMKGSGAYGPDSFISAEDKTLTASKRSHFASENARMPARFLALLLSYVPLVREARTSIAGSDLTLY